MKLVFLLLLFLLGSMFPAQDTTRVKHIHEDFQIMASGVDFRGMSRRKFASKWREQYSSIKESNLVDILIVQDKKTKKYGYVTFDNKKVTPIEYDDAQGFSYPEKIAWVKKNNKDMLVKYMAVRDKNKKYLGTMEIVQDMDFARKHFEEEV